MGRGNGRGGGGGDSTDENIVIGSSVAIGCTVLFCCIGIPMLIAGGVLVAISFGGGNLQTIGYALIGVAVVFSILGVVFVILICTGVIGKKRKTEPLVTTGVTVTTTTYPQPGLPGGAVAYNAQQGAPPNNPHSGQYVGAAAPYGGQHGAAPPYGGQHGAAPPYGGQHGAAPPVYNSGQMQTAIPGSMGTDQAPTPVLAAPVSSPANTKY